MDPTVARRLFMVPFVFGPFLLALRYIHFPTYIFFVGEDRLLEWGQFGGYLIASVAGFLIGARLWRSDRQGLAICFFAFALGFFFVSGEEISWGQRILGLQTPTEFRRENFQEEINIHNLTSLRTAFRFSMLVIGFCGSIVVYYLHRKSTVNRSKLEVLVPPLFLTSFFLMPFLGMLEYFIVEPTIGDILITRFAEFWEACLAFAVATFALMVRRRLRT